MKGDLNNQEDKIIKYGEIKGIYYGNKIPYIGYLTLFANSYLGILSSSIIIFYLIIIPILIKKYNKKLQTKEILEIEIIDKN